MTGRGERERKEETQKTQQPPLRFHLKGRHWITKSPEFWSPRRGGQDGCRAAFRGLAEDHTVALIILLGLELRWTFVCLDRWSLRANFFSHSEHSYGLMPECERR